MDALEQLSRYESDALSAIQSADDAQGLENVRVEFLGKKRGRLKDLQSLLGAAPPAERPALGKRFNEVKERVEQAWKDRRSALQQPTTVVEGIDVTLPGVPLRLGRRHPLTRTMEEFQEIMGRLGFDVADGPEIEDEFHNFEALNIPPGHPARDPLDNFYLATAATNRPGSSPSGSPPGTDSTGRDGNRSSAGPLLLRSQTSTVQIRVMQRTPPPVRVVALGRVYRPDVVDATHSCMFHQMEGLYVDRGVTMADLKTVLRLFATAYLGADVHVRFRPSFFPFTEPSVEVDAQWKGRWMELGGAGMVDPNVFRAVGYDPEQVTGFAFGLGIERFCMQRHGIDDIRRFYENDVRFLAQFQ